MNRPAIFVTGAAAGIGRATARHFAARGWAVGLYDVNLAGLDLLAGELGTACVHRAAFDVTDPGSFADALEGFFAEAGQRLDLMFNNAGIIAVEDFDTIPLAKHHAVIDVNVKGVINGCHLALPYLKRTPGARVINMASASAIYGTPKFAAYGASKFAVRGLTEALDIEWRRHGIAVRDVMPLFVDTDMVRRDVKIPLPSLDRLGLRTTPEDVARTVWRAAHWTWWPRVHWYPTPQAWFLALTQKLSPGWLNRFATAVITGH